MDITSGEISALVFKRTVREDSGKVSFDNLMLATFTELDGKNNLAMVARKTGLKMSAVREAVNKLLRLHLIELVEDGIRIMDRDFLVYLKRELSLAIGPLAEVLIEDAVNDLGYSMVKLPQHRAAELVEMLAKEIHREDKRAIFKQNMVNKIKEKRY
jgi:DNA-binding transcriptional ArsR family regulator